ncbi:MAG: DUF4442 domain-containing protein [Gordonibacter pamelaeae]
MDQEFFAGLAKNVSDGPTPFVNMAQLQAEAVEERHVRLRLPVAERHLNHVGIAYAGSEFVLAEIAGGTLFMATYGTDEFVPILKGVELKFLKPGTKDLVVDLSLTEEEAEREDRPRARARPRRLLPGDTGVRRGRRAGGADGLQLLRASR